MIGVNEITIVNWEKGRAKPTKKNLEKLKGI
jgi:DNA-binding transcriptional regulator YiaG